MKICCLNRFYHFPYVCQLVQELISCGGPCSQPALAETEVPRPDDARAATSLNSLAPEDAGSSVRSCSDTFLGGADLTLVRAYLLGSMAIRQNRNHRKIAP